MLLIGTHVAVASTSPSNQVGGISCCCWRPACPTNVLILPSMLIKRCRCPVQMVAARVLCRLEVHGKLCCAELPLHYDRSQGSHLR